MKIFLDDEREPTNAEWTVVRTPNAFKEAVEKAVAGGENIEALYLDNDLGAELEGYHLLEWLLNTYPEHIGEQCEFEVHSQNNVRREAMNRAMDSFRANRQEYIEAKNRPHPFGEIERDDEGKNI